MSTTSLRPVAPVLLLLLVSCATAPQVRRPAIESESPLAVVTKERHRLVEHFVDTNALSHHASYAVPRVEVAADALRAGVTERQAALVANNAGRALCNRLGKYVELGEGAGINRVDTRLVLTVIVPTDRTAAGASSLIGIFVPGPFRLPAGLGALAAEAEARAPDGTQLAAMRWARGANPITHSAKLSSIGDAWQLARQFGDQFARILLDRDPKVAGTQHPGADASVRSANRTLCAQRFGTVNLAGRGASLVLPMSPESIDAGAPPPTSPDPNLP